MDVPLYAIALLMFGVLYLAIGVFLAYTLIITLLIIFLYLVLRHRKLPENYPFGAGDTAITMIFVAVTWGLFVFLAPKSPIPFVGSGFTYTNASNIPVNAIILIALVFSIAMLLIFSFGFANVTTAAIGKGRDDTGDLTVGA